MIFGEGRELHPLAFDETSSAGSSSAFKFSPRSAAADDPVSSRHPLFWAGSIMAAAGRVEGIVSMKTWISYLSSQVEQTPWWAILAAIVVGATIAALALHKLAFLL